MQRRIIWKFNIIDITLIVILCISLLCLIYKFTFGRDNDESQSFLFTYVCDESPMVVLKSIDVGETCGDGDYGTSLGDLKSVVIETDGENEKNGSAVFMSQVSGEKAEHGVTIGDVLYLKGKRFNLMVGDSMFNVYISEIEEK